MVQGQSKTILEKLCGHWLFVPQITYTLGLFPNTLRLFFHTLCRWKSLQGVDALLARAYRFSHRKIRRCKTTFIKSLLPDAWLTRFLQNFILVFVQQTLRPSWKQRTVNYAFGVLIYYLRITEVYNAECEYRSYSMKNS